MKRWISTILMLLSAAVVQPCPVCEKKQPGILKGITHGAGPESDWDYVIVWLMVLIVTVTLAFTVKWMIRPGEKSAGHIKRLVLKTEDYEDR